jgi:hypothetical protein
VRRVLLTLLLLAFAGAAQAAKLSDYKGADAGWLVVSQAMPTYAPTVGIGFELSRTDGQGREDVRLRPAMAMGVLGTLGAKDFSEPSHASDLPLPAVVAAMGGRYGTSTYIGQVRVLRLAPGDYEITHLRAEADPPTGNPRKDVLVHIPVRIEPGAAVYLGEVREVPMEVVRGVFHNLIGWATVVSDQSARDLPIARKKAPGLPEPVARIPSADLVAPAAAP